MAEYLENIRTYRQESIIIDDNADPNNPFVKQLNFIGVGKSVLEFGCSTGYFSEALQKKGCIVVGVEINPIAAKLAEDFCVQVIVADLDVGDIEERVKGMKFDVISFGDVLEHLKDPWQVLRDVRSLLKPSGYVVASIPNIAHGAIRLDLLKGNFNYSDSGLLDKTHLRFFTRKTVYELFAKSGYSVESIDTTIVPIFSESNCVPQVNRLEIDDNIIKQIEESEDSTTLQFVVRAFPISSDEKFHVAQLNYSELLLSHTALQQNHTALQRNHTALQQNHTALQLKHDALILQYHDLLANNVLAQDNALRLESEIDSSAQNLSLISRRLTIAENDIEIFIQLVRSMESSKFWKLRKLYFKVKNIFTYKSKKN